MICISHASTLLQLSRDHPLAVKRGYCTPSDHFGILCSYAIQCVDSCNSGGNLQNAVNVNSGPKVREQFELSSTDAKATASMKEKVKEREKRAEAALRRAAASSDTPQENSESSTSIFNYTSISDANLKEERPSLVKKRKKSGSEIIDLTHCDD
jgi:hypothetical protein